MIGQDHRPSTRRRNLRYVWLEIPLKSACRLPQGNQRCLHNNRVPVVYDWQWASLKVKPSLRECGCGSPLWSKGSMNFPHGCVQPPNLQRLFLTKVGRSARLFLPYTSVSLQYWKGIWLALLLVRINSILLRRYKIKESFCSAIQLVEFPILMLMRILE